MISSITGCAQLTSAGSFGCEGHMCYFWPLVPYVNSPLTQSPCGHCSNPSTTECASVLANGTGAPALHARWAAVGHGSAQDGHAAIPERSSAVGGWVNCTGIRMGPTPYAPKLATVDHFVAAHGERPRARELGSATARSLPYSTALPGSEVRSEASQNKYGDGRLIAWR